MILPDGLFWFTLINARRFNFTINFSFCQSYKQSGFDHITKNIVILFLNLLKQRLSTLLCVLNYNLQ